MIIAEDAHVTYRVFASGKRLSARDSLLSLSSVRGGRTLKSVPALRGVSFTASEGETIGVVGHNGSGKSTLFRAMSGLIPTSEGAIWARDRPVLLGVNAALVPELSGENNIKLGLLAMGFTEAEAAAQVDEIADFAELNEFIHHPMRTYSSGMGARLRFAIASAKAHSILLVDEALAVGDRRFKAKSEERIRELRDSAGLVMIVSHSVGSLKDTCERVLWIHKGELRADGPAGAVIDEYVKWTKQPGGAVGAASTAKTKAAAPLSAVGAVKTPAAKEAVVAPAGDGPTTIAERQDGLSLFDQILQGPPPVANASPVTASTKTISLPPESPRDIARRERYNRAARQRTRRRIIALTITGISLLLAIGAGAAIAIVANLPDPDEPKPSPSASASVQAAADLPSIVSFTTGAPTVVCNSVEGEADVQLNWEVDDATRIEVGVGTLGLPAAAPSELQAATSAYVVPFSCAGESQDYTLVAENADGSRVSSIVTVTRELAAEPSTSVAEPPSAPADPGAESEPVSEPLPEPAPEPTPVVEPSIEPSPTPTVVPEPSSSPTPDPTSKPGKNR
ncbi:ATP-binding cassette domain-containing protein [Microbacterium jejuense]|uniref:ATP-binding cassette domain-containing protein n=1 Tax=Microbacterium jejuense TaxID=1263637 RepID=UPI0031F00BDD